MMKSIEHYTTIDMKRPSYNDYILVYVYDRGQTLGVLNKNEYLKRKSDFPKNSVTQEVVDKESLDFDRSEYQFRKAEKEREFKNDLFKENGVSDNPKAEKAFAIAWERGHGGGLEEVKEEFEELVELIE